MRISDWSSDVCSSDLQATQDARLAPRTHEHGTLALGTADLARQLGAAHQQVVNGVVDLVDLATQIVEGWCVVGHRAPIPARQGGATDSRWPWKNPRKPCLPAAPDGLCTARPERRGRRGAPGRRAEERRGG